MALHRQYRRRGIKGSQEDSTLKQLFDYLFSSSYLAKATHAYCLEALLCLIAANSLWIVQSSQASRPKLKDMSTGMRFCFVTISHF